MDELTEQQSGAENSRESYSTMSTDVTSDFAKPVQLQIHSWTQSMCFACTSPNAGAAHIITEQPNYDNSRIQAQGLINFKLQSADNGVSLCKACRDQFNSKYPGYIFYPADLQYFIDFEEQDRTQRSDVSQRKVPTAQDYLENCISKGLVPPGSRGGLYNRVFLEKYLPVDICEEHGTPAIWPVAPLAPLICALRSAGIHSINALINDRMKLFHLAILYFSEDVPRAGYKPIDESDVVTFGPQFSTKEIISRFLPIVSMAVTQ